MQELFFLKGTFINNHEKMKAEKPHKTKKVRREREDPEEEFSHMLELYTMPPPSPLILKREKRVKIKKNKKLLRKQ